ncbi:MAG TPA: RluA family pseudouridine synthase [Candidatus Acidoferrum sp.]|nr:RluA family pseudouridine synthase [Candidatus Acidoferrum sp.]
MTARDHRFSVASRCELLPYLLTLPLALSRKQAKDLLRFKAVTVKGMDSVRHDTLLEPGDVVTIAAGKQVPTASIERHGLKIVYLDDAIVVVDKPAGLLSMGSEGEKEKTAHRILNEHLKAIAKSPAQQAFIVHRLDRETSGLMMFARTRAIQAALQQDWKRVTRKYLAVVEGVPTKAEGTLRDNLVESKSLKMHRVERGGELAITHYRVLRSYRDKSLVELTLETGRKHQIRVQMAGAGHPVVGDRKYGATTDSARRLALHSSELKFCHPVSGASMDFRSALPSRLMALTGRD